MKFKSTLKYILKLLCCICLMIVPTFMLTACGGTKDPGNPPSNPSSGSDSGDSGNDVELDENGNLPEGTDLNTGKFSDFFKGYSILTNADSSLKLYDPTKLNLGGLGGLPNLDITSDLFKTEFADLVDRQIDVLAQDLLYRLTYIYGAQNGTTSNRTDDNLEIKFEIDNPAPNNYYSYNGKDAKSKAINMITNVNETFDSVTEIDLKNIDNTKSEFQKSLTLFSGDNYLNFEDGGLVITGAIEGYNSAFEKKIRISYIKDETKAWNMTCDESTYNNMSDTYKDSIKLGIAKILGADPDATSYSVDILENIKTLGYFSKHKQAITKFVLDEVIGTTQVSADDGYYDLWINNYNGLINVDNLGAIDDLGTVEDNAPRLYKGYSIVIPAIVEQALKNTFEGTETSLYPYFSRVDMNYVDFSLIDDNSEADYYSNFASINKVILQPIQSTTVLSGMELNLDTALKDSTDEIIVEVKVGVEYVSNNHKYIKTSDELTPSKNKILFTPSTTLTIDSRGEQTYTIDQTKPGFESKKALPGLPESKALDYAYIENGGFYKPNEGLNQYHTFTYEFFERDAEVTPFGNYNDGATTVGLTSRDMFTKVFDCEDGSDAVTYQAGKNYVQLTFDIVSAKKVTGEAITDYDNILFSFSIIPLLP